MSAWAMTSCRAIGRFWFIVFAVLWLHAGPSGLGTILTLRVTERSQASIAGSAHAMAHR